MPAGVVGVRHVRSRRAALVTPGTIAPDLTKGWERHRMAVVAVALACFSHLWWQVQSARNRVRLVRSARDQGEDQADQGPDREHEQRPGGPGAVEEPGAARC